MWVLWKQLSGKFSARRNLLLCYCAAKPCKVDTRDESKVTGKLESKLFLFVPNPDTHWKTSVPLLISLLLHCLLFPLPVLLLPSPLLCTHDLFSSLYCLYPAFLSIIRTSPCCDFHITLQNSAFFFFSFLRASSLSVACDIRGLIWALVCSEDTASLSGQKEPGVLGERTGREGPPGWGG